jgi:hypothetical protein
MVSATFSRLSRLFSKRRPVSEIEEDITSMIIEQAINKKLNAHDFEKIKSLVKELPAGTEYVMPQRLFHALDGPGEEERAKVIIGVINHHIPKHGGRTKNKGCKSRRTRHRKTRKH